MERFYLLIFFLVCSGFCSAQIDLDRTIDFEVSDISVSKALLALSEQANISIAFQSILFDKSDLVSVSVQDADIESILNKCLADTNVGFRIEESQIILFRKEGKKYTISGYIQDSQSGEKLVLATVGSKGDNSGSVSNDYGYYSMQHPEGIVDLSASYIGYESDAVSFILKKDTIINLIMNPYLTLDAVTVLDKVINAGDRGYKIGQGRVIVNEDMNSQPALGGETDIYRYLQTQTGVQGGADGLGGLHVRGGNAEHNLVLLDGVPVFNPSHALGLFSIFNSNSVKSVRFVKDGFSARYGGRLASVVDVRTKEGNTQKTTGEIEVGTIATKGIIEIPIVKNKSALLLSGRRTHIDPFIRNYSQNQKDKDLNKGQTDYSFFDINAKFHSEIGSKDKLYLSYYRGQDDFKDLTTWEGLYYYEDIDEEFDGFSYQDQQLKWSNELGSVRWNHVFGNNVFANVTGTYSRYNYSSFNQVIESDLGDMELPYYSYVTDSRSQVIDYGLRLDIDHYINNTHQLRYGASLLFRDFIPASLFEESELDQIDLESFTTAVDSSETFLSYTATELDAYIEDKIKIGDRSTLMVGIRGAAFKATNKTYVSILPRLSYGFEIDKHWSGRLSTAKSTQFLHVLSSSDAGLPTDLWVPSTDDVGPQQAWQHSLGMTAVWNSGWSIDMGVYYKSMSGLLSYDEDTKQPGLVETDPEYWEEFIAIGKGNSYGLEMSVQKSTGKSRGSLNYTYSKSERQFDEVNGNQSFPFSFDRPHSINLQVVHYFNPNINLQFGWQYSSGRPITLQRTDTRFVALSNSFGFTEPATSINGLRMPDYQRLDINLQMKFGSGSTRHLLNLGVYNTLNQKNPYYQYLLEGFFDENESFEQLNALPILPSVSYKIQFGQ